MAFDNILPLILEDSEEQSLRDVFGAFSSFGSAESMEEMDSAHFLKLCRDTKLLSNKLTRTDCDLIFTKVKSRGQVRLIFEEFKYALAVLSEKTGLSGWAIVHQIIRAGGPSLAEGCTVPEKVKLHDDRTLYTGVYARGGPTNLDLSKGGMHSLVDRRYDADARGVPIRPGHPLGNFLTGGVDDFPLPPPPAINEPLQAPEDILAPQQVKPLQDIFVAFASFGLSSLRDRLDATQFVKMCKDAKLFDGKKLDRTEAELIFTKVKGRGETTIIYEEFLDALGWVSEKKEMNSNELVDRILSAGGPRLNNITRAEPVRFHDDRTLYTGVHARGGPSMIDEPNMGLAMLLDRSPADVRGIPTRRNSKENGLPTNATFTLEGALHERRMSAHAYEVEAAEEKLPSGSSLTDAQRERLEVVFTLFASFGVSTVQDRMASAHFLKLMKDCKQLGKKLDRATIEIIFTKVKPRGEIKITYEEFLEALELCAEEKEVDVVDMVDQILAVGQPSMNQTTQADFIRLHDDREMYTGVCAKGGPSTVDEANMGLSVLVDRSPADVRGIPARRSSRNIFPTNASLERTTNASPADNAATPLATPAAAPSFIYPASLSKLSHEKRTSFEVIFITFASLGVPTIQTFIDSTRYMKLCRDTKLLDRRLTPTEADLIFTKIKPKGALKISFEGFLDALEFMSERKGVSPMELVEQIFTAAGPPSYLPTNEGVSSNGADLRRTALGRNASAGSLTQVMGTVTLDSGDLNKVASTVQQVASGAGAADATIKYYPTHFLGSA